MDRILDIVGNGYRLCILGDLNGWIEDKVRASITGLFGVPGKNNSKVGNTYFEHRSLYKDGKGSRWSGGK